MTSGGAQSQEKLRRFIAAMAQDAPIGNLRTRLESLTLGEEALPLSFNEADQSETCYICRPSSAYIDYALEEIRHFKRKPLLYASMRQMLQMARPLMAATGLDEQVQVNNWLFATNPVPPLSQGEAGELRDRLTQAHPTRAIVLRSLNDLADPATMAALKGAGFRLLPARRIWILDCRDGRLVHRRDSRRDQALWADGRFEILTHRDFKAEDFDAAANLYAQLYLQKYTPLNPQYRATFLAALHQADILQFVGLKEAGRLVAVTALYESGTTLTQPIVGYDTALPRQWGLYRRLMAFSAARAAQGKLLFNMSAGAGGFKRSRGATPVFEYTAVYVEHLSLKERLATRLVEKILQSIGIRLLEKFDL